MDTRCSPQWIFSRHPSDERAQLMINLWTTGILRSRFPAPEKFEALAMPFDQSVRFDDDHGLGNGSIQPIEKGEGNSVPFGQVMALALRSLQGFDLKAQTGIFCHKAFPAFEDAVYDQENGAHPFPHGKRLSGFGPARYLSRVHQIVDVAIQGMTSVWPCSGRNWCS